MKETNDCCYYVPLLQSLKALLKNECVRDQVSVCLKITVLFRYMPTLNKEITFLCSSECTGIAEGGEREGEEGREWKGEGERVG